MKFILLILYLLANINFDEFNTKRDKNEYFNYINIAYAFDNNSIIVPLFNNNSLMYNFYRILSLF